MEAREASAGARYLDAACALLARVREELPAINRAARLVAEAVSHGGVVHVFGCGHSHMLCEELFYRAGGLACVSPLFDTGLMLHAGAVKSSFLERTAAYGKLVADRHDLRPGEVIIVVSTSGRNPVPIDVALEAKKRGLAVVAVTSLEYAGSQESRHPSGRRLHEVADVVIDNHVPPGDALVPLDEARLRAGPGSTVAGAAILNALVVEVAAELKRRGREPPVFASGNLEGSEARNLELVQAYRTRVSYL